MPYVDCCKLLKWPSLSDRRNYLSLIECYKFVFGYYHLNFYNSTNSQKFSQQERVTPSNFMLKSQDSIATNVLFFTRIVSKRADLPRVDTEEAESPHHFRHKLHRYLFNRF